MSGYVSGLCYEVKFGCPTVKAVACALADNAWNDGTKAFPSVKLLSEKCEVSTRTIQRALRRLEEMGVLVVVRAGGAGPKDTREWKFDLHLLRTIAATETKQIIPADKGDTVAPLDDELRVTPVTPKGDTGDAKGDTGVTRTVTNHQEPSTAPLPPAIAAPSPSGQFDKSNFKQVRPRIAVSRGDPSWMPWLDHIESRGGTRARETAEALGRISVASRWPKDDSPLPVLSGAAA